MTPFTTLTGVAAPLPLINIDTDMIIPKQFLKTIARTGLGKNLFDEMRYTLEGAEIPGFVLNQPACRHEQTFVAGRTSAAGSRAGTRVERTHLLPPAMAAAAITGSLTDVREMMGAVDG